MLGPPVVAVVLFSVPLRRVSGHSGELTSLLGGAFPGKGLPGAPSLIMVAEATWSHHRRVDLTLHPKGLAMNYDGLDFGREELALWGNLLLGWQGSSIGEQ